MAILKGKSVALLFRELEEIDKEATEESAFLRGVGYLRTLQIPLERFKLALDLTSPLAYAEPATGAVFGVVSGVTAVGAPGNCPVPLERLSLRLTHVGC